MYTWLLWRALQSPPTKNPLYRQMQLAQHPSWLDRFWNGLMALLVLLLFVKPPVFILMILSIPILYPILSSTCYGVLFSLRTATMIFARRQQGSYDLIRIAPDGAWRSFWAVCAGSVHRNGDLDRLYHYLNRILTMLLTLGIVLVVASVVVPTERLQAEFWGMVIVLFTIMSLTVLELTQSSVLATLVGMVFAIVARTAVDSRLGALIGFLTIQLTTYLTASVLVISILYPRFVAAEMSSAIAMGIGCGTLVAYVALLRELLIFTLWRLISRQLNTAQDEMRQTMLRNQWIRS